MSEITIPVSAPGAKQASDDVATLATNVDKLTDAQKRQLAEAAQVQRMQEKTNATLVETNRFYESAGFKIRAFTLQNDSARQAMEKWSKQERLSLEGSANRSLLKHSLSMLPGGGMVSQAVGMSGGAAVGAAFASVAASALILTRMFQLNSESVARANEATLERMKIDNEMSKQTLLIQRSKEKEAFGGFAGIKDAVRALIGTQGSQAGGDVERLMNRGGEEAVKAMAELVKSTRRFQSRGSVFSITRQLDQVSAETGIPFMDLLEGLKEQKGSKNVRRVVKDIAGHNPELYVYNQEQALSEGGIAALLARIDDIEAQKRAETTRRVLNPALVLGGAMNDLGSYLDPMKEVIKTHNDKIMEEIAARDTLIYAHKSYAQQLIMIAAKVLNPFSQAAWDENIITTENDRLKRERDALENNLR